MDRVTEHVCWVDDSVCTSCGNPCPRCGVDHPPTSTALYGMCLSCHSKREGHP